MSGILGRTYESFLERCIGGARTEQEAFRELPELNKQLGVLDARKRELHMPEEWGNEVTGELMAACMKGKEEFEKEGPVGQKKPNVWGLYDMHGNVGEWCADWYGNYPNGALTNPTGASSGRRRVIRGGGFGDSAAGSRSAQRFIGDPDSGRRFNGFRPVAFSN